MSDWVPTTWGDTISLEYGKALRDHGGEGAARVYGSNGPIGWTSRALVDGPGVILGRKGAYRGVEYSASPFHVIDTAYYVVPKVPLDLRWLYYAIKYHKLGEIDDGSPIPSTTRAAVYVCELELPPLEEQLEMTAVLAALDDKIELNRRMNETLEATARAIFNEAIARSGSGRASVAELVQSNILRVGDGYRAKNSEMSQPGLPFIRAGNLKNGFETEVAEILNEKSVVLAGEKTSRCGDVAFTSKGTIGRFAYVSADTPRFVYSPQICFWRSVNREALRSSILYLWMTGEDFRSQVDAVSGQTDMAPYVSLRDQYSMTMPRYGPEQHVVADILDLLLQRKSLNENASRTLAEMRDYLLPRLMSGEVSVSDVAREIAA